MTEPTDDERPELDAAAVSGPLDTSDRERVTVLLQVARTAVERAAEVLGGGAPPPASLYNLAAEEDAHRRLLARITDMAHNDTGQTQLIARHLLAVAGAPLPDDLGDWVWPVESAGEVAELVAPDAGHAPSHGDEVEAWITADEWGALNRLLTAYRDHTEAGAPLDGPPDDARVGSIEDDLRAVGDAEQAAADAEVFEELTNTQVPESPQSGWVVPTPTVFVSLAMVDGQVRLCNDGSATVQAAVGDQSAVLTQGDSIGLHVPGRAGTDEVADLLRLVEDYGLARVARFRVSTGGVDHGAVDRAQVEVQRLRDGVVGAVSRLAGWAPPAPVERVPVSESEPVPAGLAGARLDVLGSALIAAGQWPRAGDVARALADAGWSVVPHVVAADADTRLSGANVRGLARVLADRLGPMSELDGEGRCVPVSTDDVAARLMVALPSAFVAAFGGGA